MVADEPLVVALGKYWAGAFCLLGHMFPCMFHFKGGKGILSGGTIAIMMDWRVALVVWGGFLDPGHALTKWVSLGSIWAGASFPFATWFVYHDVVLLALAILHGRPDRLEAPGQPEAYSERNGIQVQPAP